MLLGLISQDKITGGNLNPNYFVNYIDFNVIFLLVSMMIIVNISTRSGMFNWIANELLKLTKGHPIAFMQFMKYGLLVVGISLAICTLYIYLIFLR